MTQYMTRFRLGGLVWLLLTMAGCERAPAEPVKAVPPPEAPASGFTVIRPERKTLRRVIEEPAHIEAIEETPLAARIAGYVRKVHVDIGDRVEGPKLDAQGAVTQPGQVLAELSVPEMEEELAQKRALVAQAKAEVEQARGALEAAEANIATSKALVAESEAARTRAQANFERWQSEFKRVEGLVARKVIDEQTRDETLNQYRAADAARAEVEAKVLSAQAAARESEAKRNKARADVSAAQARVQVAEAEAGRLAAMLAYSMIRAPFDGVISKRSIHTGHFVQPAGNEAAKSLFVVARRDTVRVLVDIPEVDAALIQKGTPAVIRAQTIKDMDFKGEVARTGWSLDPRARTLRVEVDLPNPQLKLRPGMYAQASFTTELTNRFTLPAAAVLTQGDQAVCFQLQDGKAVRTPVRLGLRSGSDVEVLKKLVKPAGGSAEPAWVDPAGDEQVLLGNVASLSDGQAVNVTPPAR